MRIPHGLTVELWNNAIISQYTQFCVESAEAHWISVCRQNLLQWNLVAADQSLLKCLN